MAEEGGPLRQLLLSLGFDFDEKSKGEVMGAIQTVKKAALALGAAFSVKEIAEFVKETVEEVAHLGAELGHTAERIGVNAQELQVLGDVAKRSGSSLDETAVALRFLSKNAYEASTGGKEARKAFAEVGVGVHGANGEIKPATQLMIEMADRFAGMKDETERTALAMKVFGRQGTAMIPMLMKGSAALEAQIAKAKELGTVMTDEDIKASRDYEEAQIDQEKSVMALKKAFAHDLIPVFTESAQNMAKLLLKLKPLAKFLGQTLARSIRFVRDVMRGLGQAAIILGKILLAIFTPFNLTVALAGLLVAALGNASVAAGLKSAAAWIIANAPLALMILLIGIIIAAILLVIEDLVKMGDGAESVSGTMIQGFNDLVAELGGIGPAIKKMLLDALQFWMEFFGATKQDAKAFVENLSETFSNFWSGTVDGWRQIFLAFFDWVNQKARALLHGAGLDFLNKSVGSLFGGGASNPAGVTTSSAMAPPSSNGTTVNAGGNSTVVNATVTGVSTPDQVGSAVASHVDAANENQWRMAGQAFTSAAPAVP